MIVAQSSEIHFNPRSPHGERRHRFCRISGERYFNPRSPHGERLQLFAEFFFKFVFQSTLPARGATGTELNPFCSGCNFNPRSPHGERRRLSGWTCGAGRHFNPRSPHGERRHFRNRQGQVQSISIHAPRTGSDPAENQTKRCIFISIHAPRTGSDNHSITIINKETPFQSTLPARGATQELRTAFARRTISIHAPRTGSDELGKTRAAAVGDFNPRSPHGERQFSHNHHHSLLIFQSTLPARGATSSSVGITSA